MDNPLLYSDLIPLFFKDFNDNEIGRIATVCKTWLYHKFFQDKIGNILIFGKKPSLSKEIMTFSCSYEGEFLDKYLIKKGSFFRNCYILEGENGIKIIPNSKILTFNGCKTIEQLNKRITDLNNRYNVKILIVKCLTCLSTFQFYYNIDTQAFRTELDKLDSLYIVKNGQEQQENIFTIRFNIKSKYHTTIKFFHNSKKIIIYSHNQEMAKQLRYKLTEILEKIKLPIEPNKKYLSIKDQ